MARVTAAQERELRRATGYYAGKGFEYFQFKRLIQRYAGLPDAVVLERLATRLVDRLRRYCLSDPDGPYA